jgi:hypothetical protein
MPSKPIKRKADAPPSGGNKSARTGNSRDAATSIRQGLYLAALSYLIYFMFLNSSHKRAYN